MKKTIGCSCLALSIMAGGAWAAEVDMNATTYVGISESAVPGFKDEIRVPAVEYVRADVSKLGNENLSLYFYGWGQWRVDDGRVEGDLTTGYLNYKFPKANGYVKAGRFYEFQTTGVEQVDGVGFGADIAKGTRLTMFGGAPVRVDYDNKGDVIYGAKLSYRYDKYFGIGVSTVREKGTDLIREEYLDYNDENGFRNISRNADRDERFLVSGNAWFNPHKSVDINANATYNMTTEGFSEQRYLLVLNPSDKVSVRGEYRHYDLTDYFAFASDPITIFHQRDKFREYGGSANFNMSKALELTGFYKYYDGEDDDKGGEGDSDRFGVQLRYKAGKGTTSIQYTVADGKQDKDRSFQQVYLYGMYGLTKDVDMSAYALVDFYNRALYNENYAVRLAGSLGYKLTKNLRIAGQVAYDENPHLEGAISGTLWLRYDLKI